MAPVKLYVYDLSNGMARSLSLSMTGRQIDGIWHTSIVVFDMEIFYGQGISITKPGRSHHGQPLRIVDCGETSIDQETFTEYLTEIKEHYTADKYHLLDFNCNSFTQDCLGFLTGGSIPSYIRNLPADFLSTPFGAALRPQIDAMFRRPSPGIPNVQPAPAINQGVTDALLQAVASSAATSAQPTPNPATSTLTAPLHICSNPSSLRSILSTHKAVAVFFTSSTCAPCGIVRPVFEDLAYQKASSGSIAFVKVDLGVGLGNQVAAEWKVRATPTFLFFLDRKQVAEIKGVDVPELKTQVDLLIFQAFPPHKHIGLKLRKLPSMPIQPILYTQVPALDIAASKLTASIDRLPSTETSAKGFKVLLLTLVVPYLKSRFPTGSKASISSTVLDDWKSATVALVQTLPLAELFPLVDLWRLAVLESSVAASCGPASGSSDVIQLLIEKAQESIDVPTGRNLVLTSLRLSTNTFSSPSLAQHLLDPRSGRRDRLTKLLIPSLLHTDAAVRTAAASLAFNIAAYYQKPRIEKIKLGKRGPPEIEVDGEWEVEMISALMEALHRETKTEDVVHRLVASLACFCYLSPIFETTIAPLLEVLQYKNVLEAKLVIVEKQDIKVLIEEMTTLL